MDKTTKNELISGISIITITSLIYILGTFIFSSGPLWLFICVDILLSFFIAPVAFLVSCKPIPKHFFRFIVINDIYYFALFTISAALGGGILYASDIAYVAFGYAFVSAICGAILYYFQTLYINRKTKSDDIGERTDIQEPIKNAEEQLELDLSNPPEEIISESQKEQLINERPAEISLSHSATDDSAELKKHISATSVLSIILAIVVVAAIIFCKVSYTSGYERGSENGYSEGYNDGINEKYTENSMDAYLQGMRDAYKAIYGYYPETDI